MNPPKAPDPYATANAQAAANTQAATKTQQMNMIDQYTPDGSLVYQNPGTWADGTPRFVATQTLSPGQQQLYNTNQQTQQNLANIGQQQSASIGGLLATPFDMSQGAINGQTAGMPALPQYQGASSTVSQNGGIMGGLATLQSQAQQPSVQAPDARYTSAITTADPTKVQTQAIGSNDELTTQLYDTAFQRYQPQLDRERAQIETDLANRGLKPGSDAYSMAMSDLSRSRNDLKAATFLQGQNQAFNQAATRAQNDFSQDLQSNNQYQSQLLATNNQNFNQNLQANNQNYGQDFQNAGFTAQQQQAAFDRTNAALSAGLGVQGQDFQQDQANKQFAVSQDQFNYQAGMGQRSQALSELLQQRNQPINEISSLLGGSQVSQPQWTATPTANVAAPDLAGMVQSQYNSKMQAYGGLLGGLASLGGSLGSAAIKYSDERLKEDVTKIGEDPDTGLGVYKYRYKPETGLGGGLMQLGLMAGEVEKKNPAAVTRDASGYRMVDYSRALAA